MSVVWNHDGFRQILCSDGAKEACQAEADRILSSASSMCKDGQFETYVSYPTLFGSRRVAVDVAAMNYEAIEACAEDKVLERSI